MAFNLEKDKVAKRDKQFDLSKSGSAPSRASDQSPKAVEASPTAEGNAKKSYWLPVILVLIGVMSVGWWLLKRREGAPETGEGTSIEIAGSENATSQEVPSGQTPESAQSSTASPETSEQPDAARDAGGSALTTAGEGTTSESEIARRESSPTSSAGQGSTAGSEPSESSRGTALTTASLNREPVAGFGAGSAVPAAVDDRRFKEVVAYLSQNPGATLAVEGYASSEGDEAFNQRLSQERADRYKRLMEKAGIAGGRVNAVGMGIANPIATNDTEEGRRKNRRVEVTLRR